ncbi:MAG: glycosyltransferase family 4 protein [Rhodoferax sp.]|nr:glycosyltransferase family 4 protein [Rhodoferax sp.]
MAGIVVLLTSGLVSWAVGEWLCRSGTRFGLMQVPNARSSHSQPTVTGGGVSFVVVSSLMSVLVIYAASWTDGIILISVAAILAIIGFIDDRGHVSIHARLVTQTAVVAVYFALVPDLSSLAPAWLLVVGQNQAILTLVLLIAGVWWINLFNFMDGVDGLAAAHSEFMLLSAGLMIGLTQSGSDFHPELIFALLVSAAVGGFLVLNWSPARIFMGDVGSTWLAFIIFAFAIQSISKGWLGYPEWLILASVFVTDATVTLVTRILRGDRWYEAHRTHAYQHLADRWQKDGKSGHRLVTSMVLAINLLWVCPIAWACLLWPKWSSMFVVIAYAPLLIGSIFIGSGRPGAISKA